MADSSLKQAGARRKRAGTRGMPRAQREQLILDVAGTVFARAGYHDGSMDEIAALADISKPLVYAYFGSKEELYVAYIDREGRELLERLLGAAGADDRPGRRLRAAIAEFIAFVDEHRDGWKVLFHELSSSLPVAREVSALREQISDAVRRMLERDARSGLAPPASDAIAHAIVGAGESLANWWLEHPEIGRQQVANWYFKVAQAAIGAAGSTPV